MSEEEKTIKFLKALKDNYKKQTEAIVRSHNGDVYKEEEKVYKYIVEQMENILNYIERLEKENEQLRDIKNKAIGHINACKTNLGNYVLSPSEIECLLEILKEKEND